MNRFYLILFLVCSHIGMEARTTLKLVDSGATNMWERMRRIHITSLSIQDIHRNRISGTSTKTSAPSSAKTCPTCTNREVSAADLVDDIGSRKCASEEVEAAAFAEVFIHHLDEAALAEDDDTVARLQLGVTIDKRSLICAANVTTKGDSSRQAQLTDGLRTGGATLFRNNLGHIGTGYGKALDVVGIGVEHHLIDTACRYHFLVDDGADVELLGH